MKKYNSELSVGIFVFLGLLAVAYLTLKLGDVEIFDDKGYTLQAKFNDCTGLKRGAEVQVGGVAVGKVSDISLSYQNHTYRALVQLKLREDLQVFDDAAVAIKTSGIIGDKYIDLEPGGASETRLASGDEIEDTISSIDIESLISKYVFGGVEQ